MTDEMREPIDSGSGNQSHPSAETLKAFAAETQTDDEHTATARHLKQCLECRELLVLMTPEEGPPASIAVSKKRRSLSSGFSKRNSNSFEREKTG